MKVEGVKEVQIHYESGDVEVFENATVEFTKTQVGRHGDKDFRIVKYYSVMIPIHSGEETTT